MLATPRRHRSSPQRPAQHTVGSAGFQGAWRLIGNRRDWRMCALAFLLAPLLALTLIGLSPPAQADGGAPNLAYISGTKEGISIVDIASQQVTGTVALSGDPRGSTLSNDSRFLYVALAGKNGVAVIDAHARQVTATYPTGPGPTALTLDLIDPSHLWVANTGGDNVTVLNPDTGQQLATITTGQRPTSIAIAGPATGITETDGSSEVLVANHDAQTVTVIGSESFNVLATVPMPNGENPFWITVPALGGTAYISTEQGHVYGMTLASHIIFGPLFGGQRLHIMDYDATTSDIYVPDSATNRIYVLRPANSGSKPPEKLPTEPVRTLPLPGGPWSVAITNDGSLGLVAQHDSGDLTIMDVPGHRVLTKVHVGGTPQFVLAGPYPPIVNRQSGQVLLIIVYIVGGLLLAGGIGWLVWWMRKQERRIRELEAQEDAEYERQLLAAAALQQVSERTQQETASGPPAAPHPALTQTGTPNQQKNKHSTQPRPANQPKGSARPPKKRKK